MKVTYRLVNLPNGRVDLVFTVDEGDKTGIKSINFVGNQTVSSYRLHSLMQLTEMNFLSWFKTSDVYNPDHAGDRTKRRSANTTCATAMPISASSTPTSSTCRNRQGYVITITVDEGPLYHVSSETVTSHLAKVDGASLERFVTLHAGDVYNADAVDKSVEAITRDLARLGYAFRRRSAAWRAQQRDASDRSGVHRR